MPTPHPEWDDQSLEFLCDIAEEIYRSGPKCFTNWIFVKFSRAIRFFGTLLFGKYAMCCRPATAPQAAADRLCKFLGVRNG